jgi:hypothetical protein
MDKTDYLEIIRNAARELAMTQQETTTWIAAVERALTKEEAEKRAKA